MKMHLLTMTHAAVDHQRRYRDCLFTDLILLIYKKERLIMCCFKHYISTTRHQFIHPLVVDWNRTLMFMM